MTPEDDLLREALARIEERLGKTLDGDFGFWSAPTSAGPRHEVYNAWKLAHEAKLALATRLSAAHQPEPDIVKAARVIVADYVPHTPEEAADDPLGCALRLSGFERHNDIIAAYEAGRNAAHQPAAPAWGDGVYVASRASVPERGIMWRHLRASGFPIVSTWIDEDGPGQTADNSELWTRIGREIAGARGLILYVEEDDFPLKGALVEVGMALALGKPVRIVTPGVSIEEHSYRPLGSWALHPLVSFCNTPELAFAALPALPPPAPTLDPEAVAREIDPKAWAFYDRHISNPVMGAECRLEVNPSLAKARTIIAMAPPAGAVGAHAERAREHAARRIASHIAPVHAPFLARLEPEEIGTLQLETYSVARAEIDLLALPADASQSADQPHAAVGKFLSELYAIMVDPCADGTLTVEQVKNELTASALLQREALATLQADFNDCNEVRAHWKALAQSAPTLDPEAVARVIDPEAFETIRELAAARGLDASNPSAGVLIMEDIDQPITNRQERRDEALAKARTIIAMAPPAGAPIPMILHCPACGLERVGIAEAEGDK